MGNNIYFSFRGFLLYIQVWIVQSFIRFIQKKWNTLLTKSQRDIMGDLNLMDDILQYHGAYILQYFFPQCQGYDSSQKEMWLELRALILANVRRYFLLLTLIGRKSAHSNFDFFSVNYTIPNTRDSHDTKFPKVKNKNVIWI